MAPNRHRDFALDIWGTALLVPLAVVPLVTTNDMLSSLTYQAAIGVAAAMGVYIMLRLGLLSFTVPSFMALGGYAGAMLAKSGTTELLALMAVAFVVPALVAVPLSALVLRLRGVSFIFITFIFNEILQILFFETPSLTGGANGISGVPSATFLKFSLESNAMQVLVTVVVCVVASLATLAVTQRFRSEFTSIEENETLAESLGVAVWKYRTIGYVASAGVSGLGGFALVNMLSTAHPSSFGSWSVNSYIAYVFIGGRGTMLGVVLGSILLIVMTNLFSGYANLSGGLYGLLMVIVLLSAPGGIVGTCVRLVDSRRRRIAARARATSGGEAA
jgi:branched-chain amino acid transport system permease protein